MDMAKNADSRRGSPRSHVPGTFQHTDHPDFQTSAHHLDHIVAFADTTPSTMCSRDAVSVENVPFSFWAGATCFGAHAANDTAAALQPCSVRPDTPPIPVVMEQVEKRRQSTVGGSRAATSNASKTLREDDRNRAQRRMEVVRRGRVLSCGDLLVGTVRPGPESGPRPPPLLYMLGPGDSGMSLTRSKKQ